MQRIYIQMAAYLCIFFIAFSSIQNPYINVYVNHLKQDSIPAAKQQDPLYLEIEKRAPEFEVPPQNAEIHKIWRKTPGYNGLKVNIEASYNKMKKIGKFDKNKLVFEQIPPKIHLKDLPPEAIYRGHPDKPMVAFIINVAWGNEYIPDMLEVLKKHKVKATFFLEGRWAKENPDLAKMIADAGFEVGNHSYSHPDMKTLSNERIREQLVKTNEIIEATTGVQPTLFAPPSGSYRHDVVEIASQLKMETIMWSVDTIDWQRPEPHVLIQRVMNKIHPGAMILMHPTSSTAKALETLIINIQQKKYIISNVSTLLNEERVMKH
jgi:probable sporulation protein (polysaccharide deacetylase family)